MSPIVVTFLLLGGLVFCLISGFPLAFGLSATALLILFFSSGPESLQTIAYITWSTMSQWLLIALPLFVLMGNILGETGIADKLYSMFRLWTGRFNGGLAMASIAVCTVMGAMVGMIAPGILAVGVFAIPAMLKRGYEKKLVYGTTMAGGALGVLIPPSVGMIVYSSLAGVSVGKMFAGGLLPGLTLAILYIIYIGIKCKLKPADGPALIIEERGNWRNKFTALRGILGPSFIVLAVLGSIFTGAATPTESAAMGVAGTFLIAGIQRRLTWSITKHSLLTSVYLLGMAIWILVGAGAFSNIYISMGGQRMVTDLLTGLAVNKYLVIIIMQLAIIILGCFMDDFAVIMVAAPILSPIATTLGFDPIWYGILFMVTLQTAFLTPPFGFGLFFLKGLVPNESTLTIYKSALPFVLLQIILVGIVMAFPQLATLLPKLLIG